MNREGGRQGKRKSGRESGRERAGGREGERAGGRGRESHVTLSALLRLQNRIWGKDEKEKQGKK
eukprot:3940449-Rhodomonas_salina.1